MTQETLNAIKVRATRIINTLNPEWGTFGVMENNGEWFTIRGNRGTRMLFYAEALQQWEVVK